MNRNGQSCPGRTLQFTLSRRGRRGSGAPDRSVSPLKRIAHSLLLMNLLSTSACLPLPWKQTIAYPLAGRITESGRPIHGMNVFRCVSSAPCSCRSAVEATTTDKDGYFSFPQSTRLRFFMTMSDPALAYVAICGGHSEGDLMWRLDSRLPAPDEVLVCTAESGFECTPAIGGATMGEDGTIHAWLHAYGPDGLNGESWPKIAPTDSQYQQWLDHLGGMKPGETKLVPPWP